MRTFGLIGKPLSHSFSENYFSKKFLQENIENVEYLNFELESASEITSLLDKNKNLKGLNVTIPYKESILPFLTHIDNTAKDIGAVNTIKVAANGDLHGFNTDVLGFSKSLKPFLAKEHSRALIFGTGGSSKAVAYVLQQLQIPFYFVSRKPKASDEISYKDLNQQAIKSFKLLINCTPLGMAPNISEHIPIDFSGITENHLVYDLIYNPEETELLKRAKKQGALTVNGLSMLRLQAEESWKIWED